jgi:RHS repeat-associated protein
MGASVPAATVDSWDDPAGTRLVGDPVDVVTGRVTEKTLCFRLIGPLFLNWYRHYDSGHAALVRGFGFGHAHSLDYRLTFDIDGLRLEQPIGRLVHFPPLLADGESHRARGMSLRRLSLLAYRLIRFGKPAIEFRFTDPTQPARPSRLQRDNAEIVLDYHIDRRLAAIRHSTGLRIDVEEDAAHRLLSLKGPWDGGEKARPILLCTYDAHGDLVAMDDAYGRRSGFEYDTEHRLIRRTDRRGYSSLFEYDLTGRCVRSGGEDGVMGVVLRYHTVKRMTEVTRSDGGLWRYHYDATGWITHVIGPHGHVRKFIKGKNGRTVAEIDPLGHRLDYVFEAGGRLIGKRFGIGRIVAVKNGDEIVDPPHHEVADRPSRFVYGNLLDSLEVLSDGLAEMPLDLREALAPQPELPPPSAIVRSFGSSPWYPEPQCGRQFTPFGHLVRQILPGGAQRRWIYDPNDSVLTSVDADGGVIRQERRSWNQLSAWIDELGNRTLYRFSTEDRVVGVADPGGTVTEFARDKERRLSGVRRAGEVRETYHYDGVGNLVEKRNGVGATLITFIPTKDRLVAERHLASGSTHRFEYDEKARIIRASVDLSEAQFAYDAFGRRVRDERDGRGVVHEFSPGDASATTVALGRFRIKRETIDGRVTIHLPGGAWIRIERLDEFLIQRTCSNGTSELCQFDEMGRCLASIVHSGAVSSRRWRRRWRYSAEGNLLESRDSRSGTINYHYDAAHRLTRAEPEAGTSDEYIYDPAGNLLAHSKLICVKMDGGNRLSEANGERFAYDIRQHICERGDVAYRYDSRDMLVAVGSSTLDWRAEYDALGRRTRIWQGKSERRFYWDTDRLAAEVAESGSLRIYAYADRRALTPIAFVDYPHSDSEPTEGQARFIICDQRGAPVLVDDTNGVVVWEARLSPYGEAKITAATGIEFNLRFPGHYFDAATGLHYNRFRYYDPNLGRYLQSDPAGIGGGINVYAYPANPLVHVDVRGLHGGSGASCPTGPVADTPEAGRDEEGEDPFAWPSDEPDAELQEEAAALYKRAQLLHLLRNKIAQRGNTALVKFQHVLTGDTRILIATEGFRRIPREWRDKFLPDEFFVQGRRPRLPWRERPHAEDTILRFVDDPDPDDLGDKAKQRLILKARAEWRRIFGDTDRDDWQVVAGGSFRNVCIYTCEPWLERYNLQLGGPDFPEGGVFYPDKPDPKNKTRYRMFWRKPW